MKIYRIAVEMQSVPQNPTGAVNLDAQLQNLQNSQAAAERIKQAEDLLSQAMASVNRLDEMLGSGISDAVQNAGRDAISKMPEYELLQRTTGTSNIQTLENPNDVARIQTKIQTDIQGVNEAKQQI